MVCLSRKKQYKKGMKQFWKKEWFWLSLILITGVFLRFWNLTSWQHFTYDQSRDYITLKRILIDRKFTLVGPTVGIVPGFFLPPLYYYSLLPFIWFLHFHIVGPDIYTAIFGVLSVVVYYFLAKDLFGKLPALFTSFMIAINPYLIQTSRHAWNPNTLFFYLTVFILSFEKYVFGRKRKYLLLAGFSLGWAIGLHLTAVVFFPFFGCLIYREFKGKSVDIITFSSIFLFLVVFLPLALFDFRHGFPISRAGLSYLKTQGSFTSGDGTFILRLKEAIIDFFKMPVVLLSGLFQKENMTVRPLIIATFGRVGLLSVTGLFGKIKMFITLMLWLSSFVCAWLDNKNKESKLIIVFLFFGLLIRLCFPSSLFYFYYYLAVFPIVFLFIAFLLKKVQGKPLFSFIIVLIFFSSICSLLPEGIYADPKPESYFLPVCEKIAKDFPNDKKVVLAGNIADRSRWEHNGLEYRYFLEGIYRLPLGGWEASDYKEADVLYLIDEGELKDPLKLGGMEMEAFKPTKVEQVWEVETGQTVYKLTH